MIPSAARKSGIASVEATDPNATGKHVQKTTSTKISQTWLASHTGPIALAIRVRARSPRRPRPAARSHRPAPKSAPASTA